MKRLFIIPEFDRILAWLTLKGLGVVRSSESYQPLYRMSATAKRKLGCEQRLMAIEEGIRQIPGEDLSIMDIGCNVGFFVFSLAAKFGSDRCTAIGIEADLRSYRIARLLAVRHKVRNVALMNMFVTPQNVASLPQCRVILCLSVFHHWCVTYGWDKATAMLRELLNNKCDFLFFESIQSDHTSEKYSKVMPDMGQDIKGWLTDFWLGLGASKVELLGEFSISDCNVKDHGHGRYLLLVTR